MRASGAVEVRKKWAMARPWAVPRAWLQLRSLPSVKGWDGVAPATSAGGYATRRKRCGAWGRIRTTDTRIFNPLLYQLSYPGPAMAPPKSRASVAERRLYERPIGLSSSALFVIFLRMLTGLRVVIGA